MSTIEKLENSIIFMVEIVVLWSSRSRDVICPTRFVSRSLSTSIAVSIVVVQWSYDLDSCPSCVGGKFVVDVPMLSNGIVSTKVRCVVVIRFLKQCNVMRGHRTKLVHNISTYEAFQIACIPRK